MTLSEEKLMRYADGELDDAERAEVEAAIAADPELARQVARHKALRAKLRAAFDGVMQEPVPDRLVAAVKGTPAASVTDLRAARAARAGKSRRTWSWPQWGAIAASLVIGVIVGRGMLVTDMAPMTVSEGRLLARGSLDRALSTALSGETAANQAIQVGLSFRDASGTFCRTFAIRDSAATAGLACRTTDGWNVEVLARSAQPAAQGDFRPAAADLPPAVRQAIEERMQGEPLDADEEAQARARNWND